MASTKIKLNKNSLKTERQALQLYEEFLPTLELRKQQLQAEMRIIQTQIRERREDLKALLDSASVYAPMLQSFKDRVRALLIVEGVDQGVGNVAGVSIPVYLGMRFKEGPYSLVGAPPFLDKALAFWKEALSIREEIKIIELGAEALNYQLTKTTQRINLYEKVLIPEATENVRKIRVYLGDQQTAAVCRAKAAKEKLMRAGGSM